MLERRPANDFLLTGLVVTSVLPLIIAIHFLVPPPIHDSLVFDHSEFALHTLWTSAYVHIDDSHFFTNMMGYAVAIIPTWLIFSYYDRQRTLRRTLLLFFVAFPILLSMGSYLIYQFVLHADEAATRGFSGIVGAIFGLLFASILGVVREKTGWWETFGVGSSLALLVMLGVLLRGGELETMTLVLGILGSAMALTFVIPWRFRDDPSQVLPTIREHASILTLVLYGAGILIFFLPGMFPLDFIHDSSMVDIFGHAVGVFLGIITGVILTSPGIRVFSQASET